MSSRLIRFANHALKFGQWRAEAGQMVVIAAMVLPVLLAFSGLAIDVGLLTVRRTAEQRAVDAAALAGAQELIISGDEAKAKTVARDYAIKHGYVTSEITVNLPPKSGSKMGDSNYVEVKISKTSDTLLVQLIGIASATINTRGVAGINDIQRNYALIVLNPSQCAAYNHQSSSDLSIHGGGAIVNSTCASGSATQGGGSIITADNCKDETGAPLTCTIDYHRKGKWVLSNNAQADPPPTTVPAPLLDPLSCSPPTNGWLAPPGDGSCRSAPYPCTNTAGNIPVGCVPRSTSSQGTATNPAVTMDQNCPVDPLPNTSNANRTCQPGTYYGGIQISGNNNVKFASGIYLFAGGGFSYQSGQISGTAITFFNTDYPSASRTQDRPCGEMALTGSGTLNFTAPTSGPSTLLGGYKNMLFWQSPTCLNTAYGTASNPAFKYAGSSTGGSWGVTGIFYLPKAELTVSGGGNFGSVQIIVDRFKYTGSQDIIINYTGYVDTSKRVIKLVE